MWSSRPYRMQEGQPVGEEEVASVGSPSRYRLALLRPEGDVVPEKVGDYYAHHFAELVRHLMRQGASPHEAADAVQAAFVEACAQWETIEHPAAWLRTVAFRQYLRQPAQRENLTGEVPEHPSTGPSPLHVLEIKEEQMLVLAALASLPPTQRRVMAWSLDGFSSSEIAQGLKMNAAAVRQNIARARARLKELLLAEEGSA